MGRNAGSSTNLACNDWCTICRGAGFSEKAWAVLPNRAFDPGPVPHYAPIVR